MNDQLIDRRREMFSYHRDGLKVCEWASLVASKYNVSEEAVKRDWSRRRNWISCFFKFDDPIAMAKKLIADNEILMLDATNVYMQAEAPRIQLQLLWLLLKINHERANLLKDMGAFGPTQVHFEIKTKDHKEKLLLENNPERKGNKEYWIRYDALKKSERALPYFG